MTPFTRIGVLLLLTNAVCGHMQYNYFDDYLNSLNEEQQAVITGESYTDEDVDEPNHIPDINLPSRTDYLNSFNEADTGRNEESSIDGSGDEPSEAQERKLSHTLPIRTGLSGSKVVTCCSLGQLAGDKGYHCFPKFYAARILLRNQNRAHNRKMGFYGRDHVPHYGTKLMRTFEQCLASRGHVFNKCCHYAAEQKKSKPHFDSVQRKRYELKMRKIRMPKKMAGV